MLDVDRKTSITKLLRPCREVRSRPPSARPSSFPLPPSPSPASMECCRAAYCRRRDSFTWPIVGGGQPKDRRQGCPSTLNPQTSSGTRSLVIDNGLNLERKHCAGGVQSCYRKKEGEVDEGAYKPTAAKIAEIGSEAKMVETPNKCLTQLDDHTNEGDPWSSGRCHPMRDFATKGRTRRNTPVGRPFMEANKTSTVPPTSQGGVTTVSFGALLRTIGEETG